MSRVGKRPIPLPKGVKITAEGGQLTVEGPKGKQFVPLAEGLTFKQENGVLEFARESEDKAGLHGLTRALTSNAVNGVSTGFTRELAIFGIGYRCEVKGRIATFTLGYSHPIEFYLPEGIDLIKKLVDYAGDRIQVMPGGGIKPFNFHEVIARTGCRQIHVAAFTTRTDDSTHHRPFVTFGGSLMPPENRYDITDRSVVERLALARGSLGGAGTVKK